jgi:metallo-beta-lactamase family protein
MAAWNAIESILAVPPPFDYTRITRSFLLIAHTPHPAAAEGGIFMKLYFIGADHEVTGSCHFVQACGKNFLVDYGMEQGGSTYDNVEFPVSPGEIDFMLLTHAHIDHSGLIPLLCARGFHGPIYTSIATKDLCDIMLLDSAHIQEFEAEWRNRKAKRSGEPEYKPLYTVKDAMVCQSQFVGVDY